MLEAFVHPSADEFAQKHERVAEDLAEKAQQLAADPSASCLELAATHLEAATNFGLSAYWHREVGLEAKATGFAPLAEKHTALAIPAFQHASENTRAAVLAMATASYSTAWANAMEEAGYSFPPRTRIDMEAPEPSTAAIHKAIVDAQNLCQSSHAATLDELLSRAAEADGLGVPNRDMAEAFGFATSLEIQGAGVSWRDSHAAFDYRAPYYEGMLIEKDEAILRWIKPGQEEAFCGYSALDLEDAKDRQMKTGGYLLRVSDDRFFICTNQQASQAWDRTPEALTTLSMKGYSEVL